MRSSNHYEQALAAFLRQRRIPFVAVNETRRCWRNGVSLKSLDFIVHAESGTHLLLDVKGRRWSTTGGIRRNRTSRKSLRHTTWENWATPDDLDSLQHWESIFGAGYRAVLLFTYLVDTSDGWLDDEPLFPWQGGWYAFYVVGARDYAEQMKVRSPSWETVCLPRSAYRSLTVPLLSVL